jgi:phosphotriesterase-related protein
MRDNLQLDGIDVAVAELAPYVAAGGASLVEVTSHGIGRDVRAVEHVARASGVNVVIGTGYYIGSSHPRGFERRPVADLVEELVDELTVGIGGRQVRAGVIGELGVGTFPMRPGERHMLRAGARAQQATGAGMIVHPAPGVDSAFELVALLERSGAIMDKVVVSHLDERFRTDLRLFRRIGATGVRFGFDTFGREIYYPPRRKQHPNDTERIEAIARLWDAGLGERIALAQDICIRHELAMFGGQGYSYVLDSIVPRLRHRGLPEQAIETMLVDTPARILALPGRMG